MSVPAIRASQIWAMLTGILKIAISCLE